MFKRIVGVLLILSLPISCVVQMIYWVISGKFFINDLMDYAFELCETKNKS